jgi:hypothetical protein
MNRREREREVKREDGKEREREVRIKVERGER